VVERFVVLEERFATGETDVGDVGIFALVEDLP
jgi:hypothetical protein